MTTPDFGASHSLNAQYDAVPETSLAAYRGSQVQAVGAVVNPAQAMPRLFPGTLNAQDVADVAAYVRSLASP